MTVLHRLLIGTVARELTTTEFRLAYSHRSPVETNFFVPQDTATMEMPRARTANAIKRRIVSAMFAGFLAHAIAAVCEPIATEPWDRKPQPTAGRKSHYLNWTVRSSLDNGSYWKRVLVRSTANGQ